MAENKTEFFKYKNRPLVRSDHELYYGNITDKYVIKIQIKSSHKSGELEIADKVTVMLMSTDVNISPREAVIKTSEKPSLYLALDIGDIWLNKALRDTSEKK